MAIADDVINLTNFNRRTDDCIENYKNELGDFFKLRRICIEKTTVVHDHLNLDLELRMTETINLGNNKALVPLGDRIAYW